MTQLRSFAPSGLLLAALAGACTGSVNGNATPDPPDQTMGGSPGMGGRMTMTGGSAGSMTGGAGGTAMMPPPPPPLMCTPGADPAPAPLLKLSTTQYRNTVRDLLAGSGLSALNNAELGDLLAAIPDDSTGASFRGLDNRISLTHVLGYYNVAAAVAEGVAADPARVQAVAGACATGATMTAACFGDFIEKFGRRVYRRPLTSAEVMELRQLNDGRPPADVVRAAIVQLLQAPAFVYLVEVDGTPVGGRDDLLTLSPWEIASRLSYTFWQTMPDEALFKAAADGSLATDAGLARELDRVFADPRTKTTLWQFWKEWLRLETFTGFSFGRPGFKALAGDLLAAKAAGKTYNDMIQELRDLTELFTFTRKGTVADLLSTDLSVTKSPELAQIYGVPVWDGKGEYPRITDGSRAGLIQRGALLATALEQTNPFHRGSVIRRMILCDPLPQPDPASLPPGALDPPPVSAAETTRQRFTKKTDNPLCFGCHTSFNDIGFALEAYDAVGRYRTKERVFDEKDGSLKGELPIDLNVVPRIDLADARPISSAAELNRRIVESKKVEACLATNLFTYVFRHEPAGGDGCAIDDVRKVAADPAAGLLGAWKAVALQPSFRRKVAR